MMNWELKTMFRALNVFLIVLLALFSAQLISQKLEGALENIPVDQVIEETALNVAQQAEPLTAYNPVLERNIFNSRGAGSIIFNGEGPTDLEEASPPTEEGIIMGSLSDFLLRGIVFTGGLDSLAVFERQGGQQQVVVGVGEYVGRDAVIERIDRDEVIILRNGQLEKLTIYREEVDLASNSRPMPGLTDGIRQSARNSYEITNDTFRKSLDDINTIITQIGMRPKLENGACVGYEVRKIKEGSIFEDIGLKTGDVLQTVNGMNLSNPEDAFRVYKSLIGETHFNIDLLRDGDRMTMNYEIR